VPRTRLKSQRPRLSLCPHGRHVREQIGRWKASIRIRLSNAGKHGSDELREGREAVSDVHAAFIELRLCTAVQRSML
jgi:hypothetical protein